jgi:hypothetical protein
MKRYVSLFAMAMLLSVSSSCSKSSASTVDLRGRLINAPEDYFLTVCETGEQLWVDVYTLQPWWSQMTSAVDAGVGLAPPLYVEMRAKVEGNGPYGHATKLNRAVVEIEEMRTITATIPTDCSQ